MYLIRSTAYVYKKLVQHSKSTTTWNIPFVPLYFETTIQAGRVKQEKLGRIHFQVRKTLDQTKATRLKTNNWLLVSCITTGNTQDEFTEVVCPPGCKGDTYSCGTNHYHVNSSICSAATESGIVTGKISADVIHQVLM